MIAPIEGPSLPAVLGNGMNKGIRWKKTGAFFWVALGWIALVAGCALTAGWWPLPPPDEIDWVSLGVPPGAAGHLLGTDGMGRDIAARVLFGARVSLTVGLFSPLIGLALGTLLGVAAGYWRGRLETLIVFAVDTFLAIPGLVFLLVFAFLFGSSLPQITVGLGILTTPAFARVARANTVRFAEREFVLAARASGAGDLSVILREILPNVLIPLGVYMLLVAGFVIVAEGGLGFLGLSVPSPAPSWGGMIAEGRDALEEAPHVSLIPTAVMFLTVLSVNAIGDSLRGRVDEREGML